MEYFLQAVPYSCALGNPVVLGFGWWFSLNNFKLVDLKIFMLNFIIPKYKCNFLCSMILKMFKF